MQEQECILFFKAFIYLSLYLRRIVREHIDCPLLQIGPRFWAKVLQAAPKSRKMAQVTDTPFNEANTIRNKKEHNSFPFHERYLPLGLHQSSAANPLTAGTTLTSVRWLCRSGVWDSAQCAPVVNLLVRQRLGLFHILLKPFGHRPERDRQPVSSH